MEKQEIGRKDTLPHTSKTNWHKHDQSYIQPRLSETEEQTNLYIEYAITIKAALH